VAKRICFLLSLLAAPLLHGVELDIPIFAGGYGTRYYEESARLFEALRPGVRIRIYGDPRIDAQISVRVIGGNLPDAASSGNQVPWPALIRSGKVLDLAPYLRGPNWEGDARWGDTFLPGVLESWRVDGRVGGLPCAYGAMTIFYNRALFRAHGWEEPRTWDEFFALCERIRAAGLAPLSMPGTAWLYENTIFCAACYNLVGADGWRAINALKPGARLDPRYIRAAATQQFVMQHYVMRGWEGESHTGAERAFLQGRAAMTISGSWLVNEMAGKIPEGFELGAMNFPVFPDGIGNPTAVQAAPDSFFVFATGDREKERVAIDFLRFLTSRARAEALVREVNSPTAVRGVPLAAYPERMQASARMILGAGDAYAMPQTMMLAPELRQVMVDASEQLSSGRITPAGFGRRLEETAGTVRAHALDPGRVDYRHPLAGAALLAGTGSLWLWLAWDWARRRRRRAGDAPPPEEEHFGRLRGPVGLGFVTPALLLYALFVLGPSLTSFAWAFTRWDGISPRSWAGLFNFKWLLFESDTFWFALGNNLYLMVVPSLFVVPFALLCATLIHRGVRGAGFFRLVLLFPNLLGGIAAILLWLNIYQPHGGLMNTFLAELGGFLHWPRLASFEGFPWLSSGHLYLALIPIYVWMACGFNLVLYLAAMEGIDPQLYEAAELDGAPEWRQFFAITLPLIREVITISVVFLVIGGLNAFEMIWLLTVQDPAPASHTLGTLLVLSMFRNFEIGRAAAIAVVLFALVFAASAAVMRVIRRGTVDS
jgi:raffinose/stachyose/melibiose transport system permease protein